jgi:hypothetical protein
MKNRDLAFFKDTGIEFMGHSVIDSDLKNEPFIPNVTRFCVGIGSFTIVDDRLVTGPDAGNNFFLEHTNIGSSRAKCTAELLMELNDEVTGAHLDQVCLDYNPFFPLISFI